MNFLKRPYLIVIALLLTFVGYTCSSSTSSGSGDDGNNGNNPPAEFNSEAAPGDSAASYLQDDQYTSLQVEIDYMQGFRPTDDAISSLQTFLENRLNKSTISLNLSEIPARGEGPYSTSEVRSIEDEVRDNFTEPGSSTLHAHILILDGDFDDGQQGQSNVLGIAYFNTSMALFGTRIDDISGGVTQPSRTQVEATVLRHEVGHNLGLVGIGSPHPSGQESHQSGSHCNIDGCLMRASVETTNFFANFSGQIPDLDPLCIEDLRANGGK